jgi:hypothetical protein
VLPGSYPRSIRPMLPTFEVITVLSGAATACDEAQVGNHPPDLIKLNF